MAILAICYVIRFVYVLSLALFPYLFYEIHFVELTFMSRWLPYVLCSYLLLGIMTGIDDSGGGKAPAESKIEFGNRTSDTGDGRSYVDNPVVLHSASFYNERFSIISVDPLASQRSRLNTLSR